MRSSLASWLRSLPWWEKASLVGIMLWTPISILIAFAALAIAFAGGCARAVLIPESSPIRIGPETKARIYAMTEGRWQLSDNCVEIPEGWYCVPPSFVEEE